MKFFKYIAVILLLGAALAPQLSLAQAIGGNPSGATGGNPPAATGNCGVSNGEVKLCDPLGISNFCDLVKALLNIVLAIGMPVAVLFLVWSGFRFILARGSDMELKKAKENFKFVIIGIAIFLGAWTLATIISATIQTLDSSGTVQFCGR